MILPSYIYLLPNNWILLLTGFKACYETGILLNCWLLLQVCILLMQKKWGATVFIPEIFLPEKYNYHRAITNVNNKGLEHKKNFNFWKFFFSRTQIASKDSIPLGCENLSAQQDDEESLISINSNLPSADCVICVGEIALDNPLEYMITPCDHIYHKECLEKWVRFCGSKKIFNESC
jgi:hypothetical protein